MTERQSNVDRALAVLSHLAQHPTGVGVRGIGAALEMSPSTVFRLLDALCRNGFARQDGETGRYVVGMRAVTLGLAALAAVDLTSVAPPYLRALVDETGESAFLATMDDGEVVYLLKEEGRHAIRTTAVLGTRRPVHCTALGKTFLAALEPGEVRTLLQRKGMPAFTAQTVTDPDRLVAELEQVRRDGFAVDRQEIEDGLMCLAAPIRDHTGQTVAAISMAGPVGRVLPHAERYGTRVRAIGHEVSVGLGFGASGD